MSDHRSPDRDHPRLRRWLSAGPPSPQSPGPPRPRRALRAAAALFAIAVVAMLGPGALPARAASGPTYVAITFDNQWANQMTAAAALDAHHMPGTFYVISGWIGLPGFMTLSDLNTLAANGHEIGGKTVSNASLLKETDPNEAAREVCEGRNNLTALGFRVTSFAYPFAEYSAADEPIVQQCGFNSARGVGDLAETIPNGCTFPDCPYAESVPPADPYSIRTPSDGETSTTLAELESSVTNAENNGGGFLAFSFHQICDTTTAGCDPTYSVSPSFFNSFLDWLATQTANGVQVKTVDQVMGGPVQPLVNPTLVPPAAIGTNAVVNPTLTIADPNAATQPQCWTSTGYGTNSPTFRWSKTGGQGGGGQETITMRSLTSGDAKLVNRFDLGQCAPTIVPGHRYQLSVWYKSTVPVYFTVYGRSAQGTWSYWTGSSSFSFATASGWTLATWLTPPVPNTIQAISSGMTIDRTGTLSTSNYSTVDIGTGPPPAAAVGVNAIVNPNLTTPNGPRTGPMCFSQAGFGTNTAKFAWSATGGHVGGQETVTVSNWSSGDAKLVPTMDDGNCAPTVTAGFKYQMSVYYKSTKPVFFTLYSRDTAGNWGYWTQSPTFPATGAWTLATWTSPDVPSTTNGASFAMTLAANGTLSTSSYSLVNTGTS